MTENAELLDEIFPVLKTQLEMIRDNGYPITTEEKLVIDLGDDSESFVSTYLGKFNQGFQEKKYRSIYDMFNKRYTAQNMIDTFVYYLDVRTDKGKNVGKHSIDHLVTLIGTDVAEVVFISKTKLGTGASENLEKFHYRHFLFSELNYNSVVKSIFSPRIEILNNTERIEFLRSNILENPEKLAKIKVDDITSKYYNLRLGQIIRIISNVIFYESMTKKKMTYRIVGD